MSLVIDSAFTLVSGQLGAFANQDNFWSLFDVAFGKDYNQAVALRLRSQWRSRDFGSFPSVEVISSTVLGNANGAYAISTDKIYLSDTYVRSATTEALIGTLLEEYGHFVDAQVNTLDSAGDEGAIFAALLQGQELSDAQLQQLQAEDDSAVITLNTQTIEIEQATVGANLAFDLIGLTQLRNDSRFAGIDGSGFTVAVIDTGLDGSHPLISTNFRAFADFVDGRTNAYDSGQHGTHVAGTVGARDPNIGLHLMLV
jgi:subtilisin family serine protease